MMRILKNKNLTWHTYEKKYIKKVNLKTSGNIKTKDRIESEWNK